MQRKKGVTVTDVLDNMFTFLLGGFLDRVQTRVQITMREIYIINS